MKTMATSNSAIPTSDRIFASMDSFEIKLKKLIEICYAEFKAFEQRAKIPDGSDIPDDTSLKNERTNDRVVVFPESELDEVLQIMYKLNIDKIGVVRHLWNKEVVGYLYKRDIEKVIDISEKKLYPKDLMKLIDNV